MLQTKVSPDYKLYTSRAVYNLHNDFLQLFLDQNHRPSEEEKKQFGILRGELGKSYGPGRKVLEGRWTPSFEDLCLTGMWRGIQVSDPHEIEFICEADNAEARVERFEKYAEQADKEALGARERWSRANTARRERLSGNRSINESEKAEYWWNRVEAVVQHAKHTEKISSIVTKLTILEKDINSEERWLPEYVGSLKDKGQRYAKFLELEANVSYAKRQYGEHSEQVINAIAHQAFVVSFSRRYVEHLKNWEQYLKMYLEEAGGSMPVKEPAIRRPVRKIEGNPLLEKGGAIKLRFFWIEGDHWYEILRINPQSISVQMQNGRETLPKWYAKKDEVLMSKNTYQLFLKDGIERPGQ